MNRFFYFPMAACTIAAAFLILIAGAVPVSAIDAGPCTDGLKEYCSGIVPGGGRLLACLNEHADDLPSSCMDWIDELKEKMQELNQACFEEIVHYCSFDKPDQPRVIRCLESYYVQLQMDCRKQLREFKKQ